MYWSNPYCWIAWENPRRQCADPKDRSASGLKALLDLANGSYVFLFYIHMLLVSAKDVNVFTHEDCDDAPPERRSNLLGLFPTLRLRVMLSLLTLDRRNSHPRFLVV